MQIILSDDEVDTIYDALLDKQTALIERNGWYGVNTTREFYRHKEVKEVAELLERFGKYVDKERTAK